MSTYLIYGKVVKPCKIGMTYFEPQPTFRALNYAGQRVSKLADADDYATKADAQEVIDRAMEKHKKNGIDDCIKFEIRKAK